jgi:hypothetical protein
MDIFIALLISFMLLWFYFLPVLIARKRGVGSGGALFIVNLLFGWTLIGWFACLIWSATGATKAQDAFFAKRAQERFS